MLPDALTGLDRLSRNLWWSWDTEATELWRSIDPLRFAHCRHNPVALLRDVEPERLQRLAEDPAFVGKVRRTVARLDAYLQGRTWATEGCPELRKSGGVAYFSMEFGIHESLRIYSGGLGVLAGDHLRSASDLGVPLVGVGLLWRKGYFRQLIDDGNQVAAYPEADWARLPVHLCVDEHHRPILVKVPLAHHEVSLRIWRVDVGRVRLFLLDADIDSNNDTDRSTTSVLYGGDHELRLRQEMILGVGGVRALRAVGLAPSVFHMNEGHCAFAVLELARERRIEAGGSHDDAIAWVRQRCVFTTHTPVPAGHDRFAPDMIEKILGPWRKEQELPEGAFTALGRVRPADKNEPLCMTVLALRGASHTNGVSKLHGAVSREMWHELWPDKAVDEVPIGHVTNGVHPIFWAGPEARALFDRHISGWREKTWDPGVWAQIDQVPAEELWEMRRSLRSRLVRVIADRTGRKLDPDALTLGFARRFAPYKRGDMLFRDPARLRTLLERGVQIVYAGKAHPADAEGKKLVATVVKWAESAGFRDRVVFLEDYDLVLGHLITSGADVWVNNPRRPQEASGTSGQKVLLNGGINLSIRDGWWDEGFDGHNGWAIGDVAAHTDLARQDAADAQSLYETLESEVARDWFDRDAKGLPQRWITRMRKSIAASAAFNTHRMVRDYTLDIYVPLVVAQWETGEDAETEEI